MTDNSFLFISPLKFSVTLEIKCVAPDVNIDPDVDFDFVFETDSVVDADSDVEPMKNSSSVSFVCCDLFNFCI